MKTNHRLLAFVFHKVHTLQVLSSMAVLAVALAAPIVTQAQTTVLNPLEWRYVSATPYPTASSPYMSWYYTYPGNNADTHANFNSFSPYAPGFFSYGITVPLPNAPDSLLESGFPFSYGAYGFSLSGASVSVTFTASSIDGLVCYSGRADGNYGNIPITSVPVTLTSSVTNGSPGTNIACWNTGKQGILITITRFAITYDPNLKVGNLEVSQPDATQDPQSKILQVVPNVPVQVDVPISGFTGFDAAPDASIKVALQAGSQTLEPQTVKLSEIPATGAKTVSFFVTFKPEDAGPQTITATVDPDNTLGESNRSDNTQIAQVNVTGAQLDVSLPDIPLDQTQINGDTITVTAPPSLSGDPATHGLVINCVDLTAKQHLDKCKYQISMKVTNDGGHHTEYHTGDRPQIELDPNNALSSQQDITEMSGDSITLTLPEVSGETTFTINGTGPGGEPLTTKKVIFDVKIKNLFDLRALGINFHDISHHPDDGFYGNYYFMAALQVLLVEYNTSVMAKTGHAPKTLQSQAGSLSWGGLFDYPGLWETPHSRHRVGSDIDIDPPLKQQEYKALADVVNDSANLSFNPAESPNPPPGSGPVTHWHIWINE